MVKVKVVWCAKGPDEGAESVVSWQGPATTDDTPEFDVGNN